MALDRTIEQLGEKQEKTNEELGLLRLQFKELAKEMKNDRLKFIEMMRESQAQTNGDVDSEGSDADRTDAKTDRKEGNSTLKSILLGVLALGAAFALFSKKFPSLIEMFGGSDPDQKIDRLETIPQVPLTAQVAKETLKRGTPLVLRSAGTAATKAAQFAGTAATDAALKAATSSNPVMAKAGTAAITAIDAAEKGKELAKSVTPAEKSVAAAIDKISPTLGQKVAGKSVPGLGLFVGGYFAYERAKQGDVAGAIKEVLSGTLGPLSSTVLTADLVLQDVYNQVYGTAESPLPYEIDRLGQPDVWNRKVQDLKPLIEQELAKRKAEEEARPKVSAANRRRAQRGQAPVGTFMEPKSIAPTPAGMDAINEAMAGNYNEFIPSVTPVPGASTGLQIAPIIDGQTRESVATTGGAPNVTVVAPNTTNNTAVSGAGSAEPQQMAFNSTTRAAHNLDAYASPA